MNGRRPELQRVLSDPSVRVAVVEHGDRVAHFGSGVLDAALAVAGRLVLAAGPGESGDDLVREVRGADQHVCPAV
jgi:putative resolvase